MKIRNERGAVVDIRCDLCGRYFYRDEKTNYFEGWNLIRTDSLLCYNICTYCMGQPFDVASLKNPDNDLYKHQVPGLD